MICRKSNDILRELVAKTLAVGATEMQIEYEDREEHVLAFQEGVGFGIARLDASSEEAPSSARGVVSDQAEAKDCHHRGG